LSTGSGGLVEAAAAGWVRSLRAIGAPTAATAAVRKNWRRLGMLGVLDIGDSWRWLGISAAGPAPYSALPSAALTGVKSLALRIARDSVLAAWAHHAAIEMQGT
jgi:hypothetical protein